LNADITRAEYEESLLEGEESQLASLTNQIQEKELSLRQLNAELAITEAEIQRRSPMALDQDGHFEQMNEELAQLEKILKAKRKVLSELQSGETPFADLRQEIDNETVKNLLLLSALDEVREKIAELGDGESLRQVIRAEIESIPGGEVSEGDDDLVQELRLLDRSRRDFEGFRDERLASLREELALTQNDSYLKLLEADKHELERLATL
jgi:hypothetical protein